LRDTHPDHRIIAPTDADVLVLAGDIANGNDGSAHFRNWPVPVIYVYGNHEFYHEDYDAVRRRLANTSFGSVRYLENDEFVISDVRFLGCCLWTDYKLYGDAQTAMASTPEYMYDHHAIRYGEGMFQPAHALSIHEHSRAWLQKKLDQRFTGRTVVVTHHAPHPGSIHANYHAHPANPGFVSELTEMMGKAVLWIHGHAHSSFRYNVEGTEVVANPCGYPKNKLVVDPAQLQFENPDFNPDRVVEI
jgi:hypothetical protein